MTSVFDISNTGSHLKQPMFLGEPVAIARYDSVKYPQFEKLTQKFLGFFWRPEEINLSKDNKDFKGLAAVHQKMQTKVLQRQITLDSVQSRALSLALGPIVSLPEVENWIKTWEFSETIHSRTYTYILQNVYPDPGKVFDTLLDNVEIVNCAKQIVEDYDALINWNALKHVKDNENWFGKILRWIKFDFYNEYEHKRMIWRCINAINALEGIRFYASFALTWNFAEQGLMTGNANLIKLICRDENLHLAGTQHILKLLPKEDSDYVKIAKEEAEYVRNMVQLVVDQEKSFAKDIFSEGSVIGLNYDIMCLFIDHRAAKCANAIGIEGFKNIPNPLPWTQKWIGGKEVQPAQQETENVMYTSQGVKNDITQNSFKGRTL